MKKMDQERKIESKHIKGGCPCKVLIKTYSHTKTLLGKYNLDHSHSIGKDNLKFIQIQMCIWELIESWVHYEVTDQEIVSDFLLNYDRSNWDLAEKETLFLV